MAKENDGKQPTEMEKLEKLVGAAGIDVTKLIGEITVGVLAGIEDKLVAQLGQAVEVIKTELGKKVEENAAELGKSMLPGVVEQLGDTFMEKFKGQLGCDPGGNGAGGGVAIDGLVEIWADTFRNKKYFIQGKAVTAYELKPYVKAALAKPSPHIHNFFETSPEMAPACITYAKLPTEWRAISLVLAGKDIEDKIYIFKDYFYGMAVLYITFGITAAEAERWLEQSFERVLSHITLRELLNKPPESNLHTWLEALPLFPGSIAGADRRLKSVLVSRRNEVSEVITYYEQDLKIALWNCWNGSHIDECVKILQKQGDIRQQMATLRRILDGEEPELVRIMMLSMLRKTIGDLPDIRQDIRNLEAQGREIPLTEEVLATVPSRHDDLVEPSPADLLEHIGISRDNTSEAEWQVFMMLSQKVLDGELEVGSKTGLSISAALGKDALRVRKIISRYRERQLNR